MADQATKSIRRIVQGLKDDPNGLGLADDYKGLGTSRGEAFINARGDVTGSGSTGSGDDIDEQPSSGTPGTGNPDDNDTGGSGGINDGSDPVEALSGDVDAVVPAIDTDTQVGTVTGTDPDSADPVSFNPNTLDGIEYIPPDGWDDPDTPPLVPDWESGTHWTYRGGGGEFSDFAAKSLVKAGPGVDLLAFGYVLFLDDENTITYFKLSPPWIFPGLSTITWGTDPCTPGSSGSCPVENPSANDPHPSDGSCSVVFDVAAGGYKGHELDPDCSAAQIVASDSIIIRSVDDPNIYYKFTRLADGGTKITEVDAGGTIITDSVIKTIDAGGRFGDVYPESLDASIL